MSRVLTVRQLVDRFASYRDVPFPRLLHGKVGAYIAEFDITNAPLNVKRVRVMLPTVDEEIRGLELLLENGPAFELRQRLALMVAAGALRAGFYGGARDPIGPLHGALSVLMGTPAAPKLHEKGDPTVDLLMRRALVRYLEDFAALYLRRRDDKWNELPWDPKWLGTTEGKAQVEVAAEGVESSFQQAFLGAGRTIDRRLVCDALRECARVIANQKGGDKWGAIAALCAQVTGTKVDAESIRKDWMRQERQVERRRDIGRKLPMGVQPDVPGSSHASGVKRKRVRKPQPASNHSSHDRKEAGSHSRQTRRAKDASSAGNQPTPAVPRARRSSRSSR